MGFGDTFSREITIKLNDKERSKRKDQVVVVDRSIIDAQAEKSVALGAHNATLKELRDQHRKLLVAVETGVETVEVQVLERVNERRGEVETVRCDTGEVLTELTRPLTGEERQMTLADAGSRKRGRGRRSKMDEFADAED
jgi:hypothetical protein